MPLPEPKPGLVVRYDYLWAEESRLGRHHGKDRPSCIVAASDIAARPRYVVLLAITHTQPASGWIGIEIPAKVKQAIGLDETPSWVIVSEYNVEEWPSAGISAIPGRHGHFAYGFIPPALFARIRATFLDLARQGKSGAVRR